MSADQAAWLTLCVIVYGTAALLALAFILLTLGEILKHLKERK